MEGDELQMDMATSFAKREMQKKLEDFKQEFILEKGDLDNERKSYI